MKLLVDSSVWIWWLRKVDTPQTRLLRQILYGGTDVRSVPRLLIGDLIAAEVLRGMRSLRTIRDLQSTWAEFDHVCLGGMPVAVAAADMFRALRAKGVTVDKTVDLMIGAWCISSDCTLLHADRDFDPMEQHYGLKVLR